MNRRALALALLGALGLARPAAAQLRPAAHPRCTVTAHAPLSADDDLDPSTPPALLLLGDLTFVAWRDRSGGLRLQRFAPDLRYLETPRVLADRVGAFALARTATGLAVAYVERERDLVLARLTPALAAQNVPRVVDHPSAVVSALALAPGGSLLAWAEPTEVRVIPLATSGVPRGPSASRLDQPAVRALQLDATGTLRVDPTDPAVDPWVLTLRPADASVVTRVRWPLGAWGPVRLGDAVLAAQINPQGMPMLLRSAPVVPPSALADPAVAPRARLDALAVDQYLALALVGDPSNGRQALVRLLPDGSASWLAAVRGYVAGPATFAAQAPGTVVLVARDASHGAGRLLLQRYACQAP